MSPTATCSSTLWIDALTGPSSTTSAPAAGRVLRFAADLVPDRVAHGPGEGPGMREEGRSREAPGDLEPHAGFAQRPFDLRAQGVRRLLGVEAEVEQRRQRTGDDVRRAGAGGDVRDLEAGGREGRVAGVPGAARQGVERSEHRVDGVRGGVRVRDVALHAVHREASVEGPAAADAYDVAEALAGGGLADDAPVDGRAPLLKMLDDLHCPVHGVGLLVAGH